MTPCPLKPEDIRLLTEVGFLAGARGDVDAARTIFGALELCRPTAGFHFIGLAMAFLNRNQSDEAIRTLDRALTQVDGEWTADVTAVRALALHLGRRGGDRESAITAAGAHPLEQALAVEPAPQR